MNNADFNEQIPAAQWPLNPSPDIGQPLDYSTPWPDPPQKAAVAGGSSTVRSAHAFRVSQRTTPESDPATQDRIVEYQSKVILTLAPLATATVTGLATVDQPAEADGGWALLIADDLIWIEVAFTDGAPTGYSIKSYGAGDDWPTFDPGTGAAQCLVEWTGVGSEADPYVQTVARAVIARAPADGDGNPRLVQVLACDLALTQWAVRGQVFYVLEPFAGSV